MLPAQLELVKLQLHRQAECKASMAGDQYVQIKCAPVSSAALVPGPAPERACTPRNKNAAADFDADGQIARSTPAGRRSARKKCSLVITLVVSLTGSGS